MCDVTIIRNIVVLFNEISRFDLYLFVCPIWNSVRTGLFFVDTIDTFCICDILEIQMSYRSRND